MPVFPSNRLVILLVLLIACLLVWEKTSAAGITGLAVYGDSLSDEYSARSYSYASNWVELIAARKGVNVGPFGFQFDVRGTGYEYNWAVYGAETGELLLGMAFYPRWDDALVSGAASHAVLAIGSNDYFPGTLPYNNIYNGLSGAGLANEINGFVSRMQLLVDAIQGTGKPLVLVTPPDYNLAPATRNAFTDVTGRARVTSAMRQISQRLDEMAREEKIVIVDAFSLARDLFGTDQVPNSLLTVGGVDINLLSSGIAPTNGFVDDGIHPHTLLQGLLANAIMLGLNKYGAGLTPFSERELVSYVQLPYTRDSLNVNLNQYVRSYVVPEASTVLLVSFVFAIVGVCLISRRLSSSIALKK